MIADARIVPALITVELPSEPARINVSIDKRLLDRADRAAASEGYTRSAFIADALRAKLREKV
jgi:metal-responsive CopG/Arc/MetJ family transcriptional regulator